jgi:hypothetical protein
MLYPAATYPPSAAFATEENKSEPVPPKLMLVLMPKGKIWFKFYFGNYCKVIAYLLYLSLNTLKSIANGVKEMRIKQIKYILAIRASDPVKEDGCSFDLYGVWKATVLKEEVGREDY